MKIIDQSHEILQLPDISLIEVAGRTCYKSEDNIGCTKNYDLTDNCPIWIDGSKAEQKRTIQGEYCRSGCQHHSSHKFIKMLLDQGHLDALQLSGDENPETADLYAARAYKSLQPRTPADWLPYQDCSAPRLLLDARDPGQPGARGGTGHTLSTALLVAWDDKALWLAGGLNPQNIRPLVDRWEPELVDLSSGVEASPGIKDPDKVQALFRALEES